MPDQPLTPAEIGRELAALRAQTRMSAKVAGEKVGVAQSTVSRWESGRFLPDEQTLRQLCRIYGAGADVADRLTAGLLARAERAPQVRLSRPEDAADRQVRWGDLERDSARVTTAGVTLVPGLLQTEAYMRAVVTAGGRLSRDRLDQWVATRLWRQRILTESGREFVLLLCPGALTTCVGHREVMADQIAALVLASRLPSVRLGIVPPGRPLGVFPLSNMDFYESPDGARTVVVGTTGGTAEFDQGRDVDKHVRILTGLAEAASYGEQCRGLLEEAAAIYR